MAEYAGTWSYVSPTVGYAGLATPGAHVMGTPGFGTGPVYGFDAGPGMGMIYYSFGPAPTAPAAVAASSGVNPTETSYSLYGHTIPLSVLGLGRIGGDIIAGPWVSNGAASFIISFGVPADPAGTRILKEIAFDSEVVWTLADGFSTEPFTYRWYGGTLTQPADPLETTYFGADAVAYRPQMLLAFDNLPLAATKFQKIPYVAALISDASGEDVNLGEAFERLAYSPWVGKTSAEFETIGITDALISGGLIFAEQAEFLATIQQFGRFYTTWDILQTDKLRIVDRSDVVADINLNRDRLVANITINRAGEDTVKKDLELSTIDNSADYTIVPSVAQRPRDPVAVTSSVGKDTAYLPAIMDPFTRQAIVTYARYHEEMTRKTISGTVMAYGLEIEPGALIRFNSLGADFTNETFKVVETLHGANYTVEFTAAAIMKCDIGDPPVDPFIGYVVLLLSFGGADGSQVITDESPRHHGVATVAGNAQIDTAQFKYGTTSGLFDGLGDAFYWPANADWYLTDVWTIEFFVRFNRMQTDECIISQWTGSGFGSENSWMVRTQPSGALQFFISDGVAFKVQIDTAAASYTTGVWYYIAITSNGSKVRFYIDGVMRGSSTPTGTTEAGQPANPVGVGADMLGFGRPFQGWLDEVRITKAICRYSTDTSFTPPTAAFPRF